MANFDPAFDAQAPSRVRRIAATRKWSGRRTIVSALLISATLWAAIFYAAKSLIG
jgi:hypothetical protein